MRQTKEYSGLQKVAIFMISIGPELSSRILKNLPEPMMEQITYEITNMGRIELSSQQQVMDEFMQMYEAKEYITHGGIKYARDMLEKAVGPQKASDIIKKLMVNARIRPFSAIRKTDPKQLVSFIRNEHPQTVALILSHLEPEQASVVLGGLPEESQSEIARRVAVMERTSPEVIKEIESVLEKKLSSLVQQDFTAAGGVATLVEILNRVDRGTEKTILEDLEAQDHDLAEEIRKRMFVFEDVISLDDVSIRRVLREVDMKDLTMALKGASEEVAGRIYRNLSRRAAEMLKEDIDFMGPVRLRDVEEAQQRIVKVIRQLDEAGEIIISRGGEDAVVV